MAPRGRTRKRNTRMDAAVDAMRPFGFREVLVTQTVKQLLKVYGGDVYWPFIEENGYRALIDILIEENAQEGEDNIEEGRHLQNNSSQEQEAPTSSVCTTSNTVADSEPIGSDVVAAVPESAMTEEMENVAPSRSCSPLRNIDCDPPVERNGSNWKDIRLDQNSDEKETAIAVSNRDGLAQTNNLFDQIPVASPSSVAVSVQPANRRAIRRPCYGWLDYDEGELDFIYLTPAPRQTPPSSMSTNNSCGETNKRIKRKSRWDVKPEDL